MSSRDSLIAGALGRLALAGVCGALSVMPSSALADDVLETASLSGPAVAGCEAVTVRFKISLQYVSHAVSPDGTSVKIRLTRGTKQRFESPAAELVETLPPVMVPGLGPMAMSLDNSRTDPVLTVFFTAPVNPTISQSGDSAITIAGLGDRDPAFCATLAQAGGVSADVPEGPSSGDAEIEQLFSDARAAITQGDYPRAAQILTKLVSMPEHARSAEAQELLGVVRERNGQFAHAKAEYETYLEKYPDGEGAVRVRQRLAAILTAEAAPRSPLRDASAMTAEGETAGADTGTAQASVVPARTSAPRRARPQPKKPKVFGSVSSYYYLNQGSTTLHEFATRTTSTDDQVFQNALVTTVDANGSTDTDRYTLNWRFLGEHELSFSGGTTQNLNVSRAYVELEFKDAGYTAKLGRQTLNSSGVFGRFDGALVTFSPVKNTNVKLVLGTPVDSVQDRLFGTTRLLYGASLDFEDLRPNVDASLYVIQQNDQGFVDRQAIGFEGQYLGDTASAYALVDYDTYFNRLNSARISGTKILPDQSSVSASADYLNSPTLTLNNALQGQAANSLSELGKTYSEAQIQQLALDRTTRTSSVTLSYSRPLNDTWQMSIDGSVFDTAGNPASGGVPKVPAPGLEYYASAQFVGSGVFREGDVVSASARYANTASSNLILLDAYTRYSLNPNLRVKPRIKLGNRDIKSGGGTEIFAIPSISAVYQFSDTSNLELEVGGRLSSLKSPAFAQESNDIFATAGVRFEY